jgi:pimeloyl-ACP methyl ester carboxylesterase
MAMGEVSVRAPDGTAYEMTDGAGPCVALVHGLGLNRRSWQWLTGALPKCYRMLTYDLYGHGESADPPETPSLALFARQLRSLLDHAGVDRPAVVGFSLGGMIARRFAMDYPERTGALAILHSAHTRDVAAQRAVEARAAQVLKEGPAATVEAALERWFTDRFRASNPETMNLVRGWILANRKDVYASIYRVLAHGVAELVKPNPPIMAPTLVMTADEDYGNSPEMSRAIAAEIPNSRLVILPGLRHMAFAEAPELFNRELLSFLEQAAN